MQQRSHTTSAAVYTRKAHNITRCVHTAESRRLQEETTTNLKGVKKKKNAWF
jgi:hypothetical protein